MTVSFRFVSASDHFLPFRFRFITVCARFFPFRGDVQRLRLPTLAKIGARNLAVFTANALRLARMGTSFRFGATCKVLTHRHWARLDPGPLAVCCANAFQPPRGDGPRAVVDGLRLSKAPASVGSIALEFDGGRRRRCGLPPTLEDRDGPFSKFSPSKGRACLGSTLDIPLGPCHRPAHCTSMMDSPHEFIPHGYRPVAPRALPLVLCRRLWRRPRRDAAFCPSSTWRH